MNYPGLLGLSEDELENIYEGLSESSPEMANTVDEMFTLVRDEAYNNAIEYEKLSRRPGLTINKDLYAKALAYALIATKLES
jgi:hypothetical protein